MIRMLIGYATICLPRKLLDFRGHLRDYAVDHERQIQQLRTLQARCNGDTLPLLKEVLAAAGPPRRHFNSTVNVGDSSGSADPQELIKPSSPSSAPKV